MIIKTCNKCLVEKSIEDFDCSIGKGCKNDRRQPCKICRHIQHKTDYKRQTREHLVDSIGRECSTCHVWKQYSEFYLHKRTSTGYNSPCNFSKNDTHPITFITGVKVA